MTQTAVEWLEFRYKNNINLNQYDFEQAKEIQKSVQALIDTYQCASCNKPLDLNTQSTSINTLYNKYKEVSSNKLNNTELVMKITTSYNSILNIGSNTTSKDINTIYGINNVGTEYYNKNVIIPSQNGGCTGLK
jgi:hypothetical protein